MLFVERLLTKARQTLQSATSQLLVPPQPIATLPCHQKVMSMPVSVDIKTQCHCYYNADTNANTNAHAHAHANAHLASY